MTFIEAKMFAARLISESSDHWTIDRKYMEHVRSTEMSSKVYEELMVDVSVNEKDETLTVYAKKHFTIPSDIPEFIISGTVFSRHEYPHQRNIDRLRFLLDIPNDIQRREKAKASSNLTLNLSLDRSNYGDWS
jgi:hypothetical protein